MTDLNIPRTAADLEARQVQGRRRAVVQALKSPFMAARLGEVELDGITKPDAWQRLPILDKDMLREMSATQFYTGFCIADRSQIAEYWRSGGSTGRPLFYPRTREDMAFGLQGFARVLACAGLTRQDVTHLSLPLGMHPAGHLMGRASAEAELGVVWAGGGNTLPSAMQIEMMALFQPTAWIGMASYGLQLANLARAQGIDLSQGTIRRILCTAEPLSASKRAKLEALFGAVVRDSYGMTEAMMLGCEDALVDGFRFWSDYCYPEVLDPDTMEPVADGRPGLLVVTPLVTNNATPFLRWNTGDIVTIRRDVPGGGPYDVFPLIKHTHRTAGFVKVRGVNIGFTDFEDLMFRSEDVADFRVEILFDGQSDVLDLQVELAEGASRDRLIRSVRDSFEVTPRITALAPGAVAQGFEGAFKPQRFTDRRSES